jgi:dolichol kinase
MSQPQIDPSPDAPAAPDANAEAAAGATATRFDFQPGRRLFHLANGATVATAYALFFTRNQVIHLFGIVACLVYVLDRVRIQYPELMARLPWVNRSFFRAEEQVREAAATPFAIAILLTILTFPKPVALLAIYTLAIADPLSAVVGIRFGKHRLIGRKTLEGSLAFLVATFAVSVVVLGWATDVPLATRLEAGFLIAALGTILEGLPWRIDDNLTIPLGVAAVAWLVCAIFGVDV